MGFTGLFMAVLFTGILQQLKQLSLIRTRFTFPAISSRSTMAAAPAEPNGASIEALFRPSTRFQDSHPNLIGYLPENCTEVELLPGLTVENIRVTRIFWDAFHRFARNKIVWMTPDVYVCTNMYLRNRGDPYLRNRGDPLVLVLGCDALGGTTSLRVYVMPDTTAAAVATATCDFLLRVFATCEQCDLHIEGSNDEVPPPLSGAGISLFFQESRSCLRQVVLCDMVLNEDHCRALATMSRLDVELHLDWCSLADDAAGAFVECLQSDRGPVKLKMCKIDSQILANALTGDSRVTRLEPDFDGTDDAGMAILFRALANNRGLVDFDSRGDPISDENWMILCESIQAHPTLTSLGLFTTMPRSPVQGLILLRPAGVAIIFSGEQKTRRTRRTGALAEMMQTNTVLHTIELLASERNNQIYTEEIQPYLVTNLYRPRVLAVKKTKDRPFREKVLGRAVYSVRSNPNLVWMLLSENVDAFVRSEYR
jgi:hypothetical protein